MICSEDFEFLEAIRQKPHDRFLQLMYADFLEENGRVEDAKWWRWSGVVGHSPLVDGGLKSLDCGWGVIDDLPLLAYEDVHDSKGVPAVTLKDGKVVGLVAESHFSSNDGRNPISVYLDMDCDGNRFIYICISSEEKGATAKMSPEEAKLLAAAIGNLCRWSPHSENDE